MEVKLLLAVSTLLVHASLALCQRVTVKKGQTLHLSCPITNAHKTNVEWKNPKGNIMFFNRNRALKDKRYRIDRLSASEFSISVSNVTFKDGGNYTCTHYDHHTTERKVEVTVLGHPMMKVVEHEGKLVIKCTAEGNHHPPQISWQMDRGPEVLAHAQVSHEDRKYVSMAMLHVHPVEKRVTVKCLVRHPALLSPPLMNFVKIGPDYRKFRHTTTSGRLETAQPAGSAGSARVPRTTTSGSRHGTTTTTAVYPTATDTSGPPSESPAKLSAVPSDHPSSSSEPATVTAATRVTGSRLSTTGSSDDSRMQAGREGRPSLLVFLVTCLIFCLLVVVLFFAIKLRRAHVAWKRENEDTDQSEESSKSKSSQEERSSKEQGRRGLSNMAFTQYVAEKPTGIMSKTGPVSATESANKEHTSQPQPQTLQQSSAIKETEL
ncbi:putative cytotoxic and regulatory T-cell molecule-like isoform 2 [Scophthalmus maximus]|uniref:Putative cytotoxic and regulatory T-cell molecule-like isoform 2 n=1 Tax=Scophthalmus maximus TaxID=52904 RepID=A0A2U9B9E2_SCOMX|nr:putative cytotoxic and regulatory T-cell molecule-like isoform 2 [Scophthalmus maximus]